MAILSDHPVTRKPCEYANPQCQVTSGPFADSNEKVCAYELIECANMEEAVGNASRHPMAKVATIEVRPVWSELANG
ncbi:MAG: YciI family protein [Opitutales bacterium]|nr:YciI family protein [Opitutales bacterium]